MLLGPFHTLILGQGPCASYARAMSEWTFDTLKLYYDQRFDDLDKAVTKAETANERRFDSVNEFRAQLADQAAAFLPRTEYTARHDALVAELDALREVVNQQRGGSVASQRSTGTLISVLAVIVAAGTLIALLVIR